MRTAVLLSLLLVGMNLSSQTIKIDFGYHPDKPLLLMLKNSLRMDTIFHKTSTATITDWSASLNNLRYRNRSLHVSQPSDGSNVRRLIGLVYYTETNGNKVVINVYARAILDPNIKP